MKEGHANKQMEVKSRDDSVEVSLIANLEVVRSSPRPAEPAYVHTVERIVIETLQFQAKHGNGITRLDHLQRLLEH